jgi:predicted transcriptional regulator
MDTNQKLVELTADVVAAYLSANEIRTADVGTVIADVYNSLSSLGKEAATPEPLKPPVSIRKSITPDYLISLEDGRQYKSLKRHLAGRGLTPAQYREKWGLPRDYPMVAPAYAAQRSELAKKMGLGRKMAEARSAKAAAKPARKGGRRKAA